jgi:assimilatory nitrate reductase catalytic subunit
MIDLIAHFAPTFVLYVPLWPAGHLPRKGGDHRLHRFASVAGSAPPSTLPISPLAGEMSGRTEGGAVLPAFLNHIGRDLL